jgi:hypothetical protein
MAALTTKVAPQGAGTKDNKGNNDKIFVFLKIRNVSFWSRLFLNVPIACAGSFQEAGIPFRLPSALRATSRPLRSACGSLKPAPKKNMQHRKKPAGTERNLQPAKET